MTLLVFRLPIEVSISELVNNLVEANIAGMLNSLQTRKLETIETAFWRQAIQHNLLTVENWVPRPMMTEKNKCVRDPEECK